MLMLVLWASLAILVVHFCSWLETTLLSVRVSTLLDRAAAGNTGAARLLDIKRNHMEAAIGAVLTLNTLAGTLGPTLAGAAAARHFGGPAPAILSAALILFLLIFSELLPKTLAALRLKRAQQLPPRA
ncbi:MAG: CNNM domain-containing protein [Rhodospirillales bacterium]|nr:CNNM domain-containing protein [Rhodospirillales bacterium]